MTFIMCISTLYLTALRGAQPACAPEGHVTLWLCDPDCRFVRPQHSFFPTYRHLPQQQQLECRGQPMSPIRLRLSLEGLTAQPMNLCSMDHTTPSWHTYFHPPTTTWYRLSSSDRLRAGPSTSPRSSSSKGRFTLYSSLKSSCLGTTRVARLALPRTTRWGHGSSILRM